MHFKFFFIHCVNLFSLHRAQNYNVINNINKLKEIFALNRQYIAHNAYTFTSGMVYDKRG